MKKWLTLIATALFIMPLVASAHGPTPQQLREKITINASPDKVWAIIKDFGNMQNWHPAIISTEMKNDVTRVLTLKLEGNPTITEELIKIDDEKMMVTYKVIDMSVVKTITFNGKDTPYYTLPIKPKGGGKSWLSVKAIDGGGSEVHWRQKFYRSFNDNPPVPEGQSDKDAVNAIKGVITAGLKALKATLEK